MENSIFVNQAFTLAINKYLDNKDNPNGIEFNSFFVVVIRLLTLIYDELDIINPYNLNKESILDTNLRKYGYGQVDIIKFKNALQEYYEKETEEGFIFIQKAIIDMFIKKNLSIKINDEEVLEFRSLLYSPYGVNPLIVSYNFMMSKDPLLIVNYFDKQLSEHQKKEIAKVKETLNLEAYEILKYSLEDIDAMNAEQLDKVNKEVYGYFDINENAINKKYLLDKAVFDYNHPKPAFSTGNGFVDILFFLSIIATLAMIIIVITIIVV